jgi:pimeloyl-ACP methyl ester carboxylesterase
MDPTTFERERLALFANYGFQGESRTFTGSDGHESHFISKGAGPNPTLLLHGGLSEASEWCLVAGKLGDHVVIPDRPNCGLSDSVYGRGVDFREHATAWMLDLADNIGAEQIDVVGNSIGGFFSIAFALAHPERVRKLVLVGAPMGLERSGAPLFPRLWSSSIFGPIMMKLGLLQPKDAEDLRKQVFATMLVAHPEKVPDDFLAVSLAAGALPGAERASYEMLRKMSTIRGARPEVMLRDEMPKLATPTLFIWGDSDKFSLPSIGHEVAAEMPNARIEVLAEAGHVPHLEQPDEIAALLTNFFSDA